MPPALVATIGFPLPQCLRQPLPMKGHLSGPIHSYNLLSAPSASNRNPGPGDTFDLSWPPHALLCLDLRALARGPLLLPNGVRETPGAFELPLLEDKPAARAPLKPHRKTSFPIPGTWTRTIPPIGLTTIILTPPPRIPCPGFYGHACSV